MRIKRATILLSLAVAASACSGSEATTETTAVSTTEAPAVTTTAPAATTTTASVPTPPESMPGDIIEFGPRAGDQIAVVGVEHDDTLNVRIAPGVDFEVIDELGPDELNVIAAGENRLLPTSFWVEIESGDGFGWVNEKFVGFMGVSRTATSDIVSTDGPEAIGLAVAEGYMSLDPRSRVVLTAVDGATVTYDVLDLGDDAVKGLRLTIETDGDAVTSVTEQTICSRGLAPDDKCV